MAHAIVPSAEDILDREFPVLDKGFVRLVDYMGGDERIVQAARVSYQEGTTTKHRDKGLIDYLMRHKHTSPFEQVILTFHCKLPIFVARQWVRHRTARLNELSGRYSVLKDEFYVPTVSAIRFQDEVKNKQGSTNEKVSPHICDEVLQILMDEQFSSNRAYQKLLDNKIARELARISLPLSVYTEWYWQIDLHNLFHFLKLRIDEHAQLEIRQYAKVMAAIVKCVVPMAYEAFEDHILNGVSFSGRELNALRVMLKGDEVPLQGIYLDEFMEKLNKKEFSL